MLRAEKGKKRPQQNNAVKKVDASTEATQKEKQTKTFVYIVTWQAASES